MSGPGSVLLLGNYGPSLAVARSLAALGYRVIAGDGGEFATVASSRSCAEVWRHPPARDEDALLAALRDLVGRRPDIHVIVPLRPNYLEVLARRGSELAPLPPVAMADPETTLLCLDKARLYGVAESIGIRVEPQATVADLDELAVALERIGTPCVVRPIDDTTGTLPGGRKVIVVHDAGPVDRWMPAWPHGQTRLLVQRYAPGPRHNLHFAAIEGRVVGRVETMVLRTDRIDGTGLGVEGISVAPRPDLQADLDRLVARLGLSGVGLAQFLVPPGGEPHLLELNPRLGTALAFIQALGLDLARAAVAIATGEPIWTPDPDAGYPVGRRYAWTSKDLNGLRAMHAAGQLRPGEGALWLRRLLRGALRADTHLTWSWRDPGPTIGVYRALARETRRATAGGVVRPG